MANHQRLEPMWWTEKENFPELWQGWNGLFVYIWTFNKVHIKMAHTKWTNMNHMTQNCRLLGYLQVFLGGSVLWWQRVVSLSHLYQPLFGDCLFLQRPNKKMLTDLPTELYKHLWHLGSALIKYATLTMSLVGTGSGCLGVGAMSFRVSDRASRAESDPASS